MQAINAPQIHLSRRGALKAAAASTLVSTTFVATPRRAMAQTSSDIDALNFMLNIEYLLAQMLSAAVGEVVPADRLLGDNGRPGIAPLLPPATAYPLIFTDSRLRSIVQEMAADNRQHLIPMRQVVGAPVVRQPLLDLSVGAASAFSVAMQRAGVVPAGTAFNPFASEENLVYAIFFLKNISVAAYRGLTGTIVNRVVTLNFMGLLGTEAIHSATIRSYIHAQGQSQPRLLENAERIAAYQRSLNGGGVYQGLAPSVRSVAGAGMAVRVANVSPAQADGQTGQRSAAQILNALYLNSSATTSGGFFPEGVGGGIRTSASA